jgi:hypothetical protein
MNLPDYFFADLPPEATLSPAMITASCHTLKRNRASYLAGRTTDDIIKILCEVAAAWRSPDDKFRKHALEQGPAATGFSHAVLAKGLDDLFEPFTPAGFESLLQQELGHPHRLDAFQMASAASHLGGAPSHMAMVHGPELLVHIAAGNVPNPAVMSLTLGLLLRSAQFVKCASGASFLPRLFAHSLYETDRKLASCIEVASWPGGAAEWEAPLFAEASCLTATGSDETLAAIRARLPSRVRFVGYGQRVSFSYVTREILRDDTIAAVVASVADDVVAWDQNGCLSPQVIYVEERGVVESDQFASKLALELARRELVEPRGRISTAEAAAIASRRAIYETLAAHRADVKLWASPDSTAWTVVFEHDVRFQFSPLNRFIYVKPVPDLVTALRGADDVREKVSTVGIGAPAERTKILALEFGRWGATRICPIGRMQKPSLTWRHDGRPPLGDLVVWTDFECAADEPVATALLDGKNL